MNEAFVDFTGGVGEVLYLRQDVPVPGLFSVLRHALAKESLVGATALVRQWDSRGALPPEPVYREAEASHVLLSLTAILFALTNRTQAS